MKISLGKRGQKIWCQVLSGHDGWFLVYDEPGSEEDVPSGPGHLPGRALAAGYLPAGAVAVLKQSGGGCNLRETCQGAAAAGLHLGLGPGAGKLPAMVRGESPPREVIICRRTETA